ncbi:unnamed protein product [Linum trigynum]|uniref:Uncharacterized protein n=1 Tax=Linum trigynum TaxID=586398 RepID=A0AAV2G400_9ROSI
MDSLHALANSPPSTISEISGRPSDNPLATPAGKAALTFTYANQPLNFKAALARINQDTAKSLSQWTFVGTKRHGNMPLPRGSRIEIIFQIQREALPTLEEDPGGPSPGSFYRLLLSMFSAKMEVAAG